MAKATPPPSWEAISQFYAGRPMTLNFDPARMSGANTAGIGSVNMPGAFKEKLAHLLKALQSGDKQRMIGASVSDIDPLAVLIHESIHNRDFTQGQLGFFPADKPTPSGFMLGRNEPQAQALGAELIPDLLQRFFGIKIGSPMSNRFARNAKSRSEYDAAYAMNGLPPPRHG